MIYGQAQLTHDDIAGLFRELPMNAANPVTGDIFPQGKGFAGIVPGVTHRVFIAVKIRDSAFACLQLHRIKLRQHKTECAYILRHPPPIQAKQVIDSQLRQGQLQLAAAESGKGNHLALPLAPRGRNTQGSAAALVREKIAAANLCRQGGQAEKACVFHLHANGYLLPLLHRERRAER